MDLIGTSVEQTAKQAACFVSLPFFCSGQKQKVAKRAKNGG
jgi:hypothetical protein